MLSQSNPFAGRTSTSVSGGSSDWRSTIASVNHRIDALEAENRRLREEVLEREGSEEPMSQPGGRSQQAALSELCLNAAAGPSAPPSSRAHSDNDLFWNFRRVCYERAGIDHQSKTEIWQLPRPRSHRHWPTHPPNYEGEDDEPRNADDDGFLLLRPNFAESWMHPSNKEQFDSVLKYLLAHRKSCKVPPDLTLAQLRTRCRRTFDGWKYQYGLSQSEEGRARQSAAKDQARVNSKKGRKCSGRSSALGIKKFVHFSNGSKVERPSDPSTVLRVRRGAVRADIEFAMQNKVMSPDEKIWEANPEGEGRWVVRALILEWRSRTLNEKMMQADKKRIVNDQYVRLPPLRKANLPADFKLPSDFRRWMVDEEWARSNPEAVSEVSINAGPFGNCPFAVSTGAEDWGPTNDRPENSEDDDSEEERDRERNEQSCAGPSRSSFALGGVGHRSGHARDGHHFGEAGGAGSSSSRPAAGSHQTRERDYFSSRGATAFARRSRGSQVLTDEDEDDFEPDELDEQ
ncbi:hypothetical protein CF326_g6064 [Tilletia indica]|nr:hypothetical protein CF326_g6064 [Tilletia indica]